MVEKAAGYEQVVSLVLQLSPLERVRLVEAIMATLEKELADNEAEAENQPKQSLYGLWADLGPAPSAEEIDEIRREMWGNFPREDI